MTRLPALTYREVTVRLRDAGFVFDRQAKGSHEIWYNPITHRRATAQSSRDNPTGHIGRHHPGSRIICG